MSFFQKYELLRLLHEGEAKTFKALERASGRHVLFHMLAGDQQSKPGSLLEKAKRLRGSPQLIEVGEFANSPYVVTEYSESFTKLSEWLDHQPASEEAAVQPPSLPPELETLKKVEPPPGVQEELTERISKPSKYTPPAAPPGDTGEFTRIFEKRLAQSPVAADPPKRPEPVLKPIDDAGEFTSMFENRPSVPPSPPPQQERPNPPEPVAQATDDVGDFTRMFESRFEKRQPPANELPSDEPSDFSRFFGPGIRSEPINIDEEHARQAASPEPVKQPFRQPSEFTKRFGPSAEQADEPPLPDLPRTPTWPSTSTDLFGSVPKQDRPSPVESEPAPGEKKAPGEYTRVVRTAEGADEAADAGYKEAPVVPAKRRDMAPLIIAGALLVATVVIVLLLVLRGN